MPEYINQHNHTVKLIGPDNKIIILRPKQRKTLSNYFERYTVGASPLINNIQNNNPQNARITKKERIIIPQKIIPQKTITKQKSQKHNKQVYVPKQEEEKPRRLRSNVKLLNRPPKPTRQIVGRKLSVDATKTLKEDLETNYYPISNNIGIGILSYNRPQSIKRLINSILQFTNLKKTTVFISDDASDNQELLEYLDSLNNIIVIKNKSRAGIAVNTNRLLKCLSRFKYGILLNDDVEILRNDWEYLYPNALNNTGFEVLMHRQEGIYGAKLGQIQVINETSLRVVYEKPHGAIIAFTNNMLSNCGYFDENYGLYGMEHVDWCMRPYEFGIQPKGFYDVNNSLHYFKLHNDPSALENKSECFSEAKEYFNNRVCKNCQPTDFTDIPSITYIIPYKNTGRNESVRTVINNIRAQPFPIINIIVVEHDNSTKIDLAGSSPLDYYIVESSSQLFNKSKAFNFGVANSKTKLIVLHDADMLVPNDYTKKIYESLCNHDSCHLGKLVVYANNESTNMANQLGIIDENCECERIVGYFEGGSLACSVDAYWQCGGFNEDFNGYGCEDCDFYSRLSSTTNWKNDRIFSFLHLWHDRVSGWDGHHKINKQIIADLDVLPMSVRVARQHQQLRMIGYGEKL